ncbi:MAG: sulfotransferase [Candidatus Sumerlaeaceae bacterium]|nr:sulfotransferase [Candidatus Sumerlaeaceae bacterium]
MAVDSQPVFIVGVARSGTTLLQQMLDHHPAFAFPWESHFIPVFHRHLAVFGDLKVAANRQRLIEAIVEYVPVSFGEKLPGEWIPGLSAAAPEIAASAPADYAGIVDAVYQFMVRQRGRRRWGDKTPGYINSMPLLLELFPGARFIHMVRDGRDVAASVGPLSFGPSTAHLGARKWVSFIRHGLNFQKAHPDRVMLLKYEDLAADPETHCRKVCEFLGEEFDPAMLSFHEDGSQRIPGQGIHEMISQPPSLKRVGRWKKDLTPGQVRVFEAIAGPMLQQFGYELSQPRPKVRFYDKPLSVIGEKVLWMRPNTKPLSLAERLDLGKRRKAFRAKYGF